MYCTLTSPVIAVFTADSNNRANTTAATEANVSPTYSEARMRTIVSRIFTVVCVSTLVATPGPPVPIFDVGNASIATVSTMLSTTISISTGQIDFFTVLATGSTMIPVMFAIASTPEMARINFVNMAQVASGLVCTFEMVASSSDGTANKAITRLSTAVRTATTIAPVPAFVGPK
jgi:hypothetical protein